MAGSANPRGRDIVVVGASAGGVEALPTLLGALAPNFNGNIFVVMHLAADSQSHLPEIISRNANMQAIHPRDREEFRKGTIYVAPPDQHMVLEGNRVRLLRGPKENRHRPAVDPLFRSAAGWHGPHVTGVILTGALDDGTQGLLAVKQCGGKAIVQHPEEANYPSMPLSALKYVEVDHCLPLKKIPAVISKLAKKSPEEKMDNSRCSTFRVIGSEEPKRPDEMQKKLGHASSYICPECSGPIWEVKVNGAPYFQCLVGHAYAPESFLAEEKEALEKSLWVAIRTMQERASLFRRLASDSRNSGQKLTSAHFNQRADEHEQHARVIRKIITDEANKEADTKAKATYNRRAK